MASGVWLSQNKVRPGCYINFKAVPKSTMTVGDRGIVALPLFLKWGDDDKLIEVLSSELLNGDSLKHIGYTAFDEDSKLLASALNYCYKALIYKIPTSAESTASKATLDLGTFKVEAKYTGTFGNNIKVTVEYDEIKQLYTVITWVKGETVDKQIVVSADDLIANDYVVFSGTLSGDSVNAGQDLTGGADGTPVQESEWYPKYLKKLESAKWQTMCCFSEDDSIKQNIVDWVQGLREDEGRYVQGVVYNYDGADYEGIINSISSVEINGIPFSGSEFVAVVAGMTAGANINQSNTARIVDGATKIINNLSNSEIIEALQNGKFLISESLSGKIKVEQDINSLHTYSADRNYSFSKNRVIRTLDEIGTTTVSTWEDKYMGKFNNNSTGRELFKLDLSAYANSLQTLSAIQDFSANDISIAQGKDLDSVVATWRVKPVDSMEKLYLTVNVDS